MTFSAVFETSTIVLEKVNDVKALSTPGYPNDYPANAKITFTVLSPEGSRIKLDFLNLFLSSGCEDRINTYDGKSCVCL